ncbi:hypothetical protein ABK040_011437 [Willaertia magna]
MDCYHKNFNSLPTFVEAKKNENSVKIVIDQLLALLSKEERNLFGFALLHKHFDIANDETVVERPYKDYSIIEPTRQVNRDIITPYLFNYNEKWNPLEFVKLSEDEPTAFQTAKKAQNYLDSENGKEFCVKIASKLQELNLDKVIGLAVNHRKHISEQSSFDSTLETEYEGERTLKISPMNKVFGETTETFFFPKGGDGTCIHGCKHCSSHKQTTLHHCKHCSIHVCSHKH